MLELTIITSVARYRTAALRSIQDHYPLEHVGCVTKVNGMSKSILPQETFNTAIFVTFSSDEFSIQFLKAFRDIFEKECSLSPCFTVGIDRVGPVTRTVGISKCRPLQSLAEDTPRACSHHVSLEHESARPVNCGIAAI